MTIRQEMEKGCSFAKETDTHHMSSLQVMKLDTRRILTIIYIQHLWFYLIAFHRLGVHGGKMIRPIIFC